MNYDSEKIIFCYCTEFFQCPHLLGEQIARWLRRVEAMTLNEWWPGDHAHHDDEINDHGNLHEFMMILMTMMTTRKRAENKRFRKKKDIDVINENDDAIAKMIADMRIAAKEDRYYILCKISTIKKIINRDLNIEGKPGINKMRMFPVCLHLRLNLNKKTFLKKCIWNKA